jgi:predicted GNAT family N-acyltransferase
MTIEYYYINPFNKYNKAFEELGYKKGNINELLRIIKINPLFCRNQKAINYDYFIKSISQDAVIYITDDENVSYNNYIVGCCTLYINSSSNSNITITGICVPFSSEKKYGTLLLNAVKRIGEKIKSDVIYLGAKDSNKDFYLKNGFIINKRYKPEKYDRLAQESEIDYDVDMKYTLNLVGGKIKKHNSTNKKRKYKSKTKRMT